MMIVLYDHVTYRISKVNCSSFELTMFDADIYDDLHVDVLDRTINVMTTVATNHPSTSNR